MINVNYKIRKEEARLFVSGHAGFAAKGKDIVCAAVSGLCIALKETLFKERCPQSDFSLDCAVCDGSFYIKAYGFSDAGTALRVLSCFNLTVNGMKAFEKMYSRHIRVINGISPLAARNNDTSEQTMIKREKGGSMSVKDSLQHFSEDASVGETASSAENETAQETELSAEEEFENLIRGKYSDAFKKRTQGIIDRRFAKMKGYENTAKVCSPLIERLSEIYPDIDKNDTGSLVEAFLSDKSKSDAEKEKREAFSQISEKIERVLAQRAAHKLSLKLREEAEKLREIYPDFDLSRELSSSPELKQLLQCGVGLRRAYETVNLEKILMSSMRYAALQAGKSAADSVRNSRVQENSLSGNAASVGRTDVKNLTEKDIMKILSEVSRGAKISFR